MKKLFEEYARWLLGDLLWPHALARAFFMRPAKLPRVADRSYQSDALFWQEVLAEKLGAERVIKLSSMHVSEWFPRNPGLYYMPHAEWARQEAQSHIRQLNPGDFDEYLSGEGAPPDGASYFRKVTSESARGGREIMYTPRGKFAMLSGGVGCVRYKPVELKKGGTAWLLSASSRDDCDEVISPDTGIPLLVRDELYALVVEGLHRNGSVTCNIVGKTRYVADEFLDIFSLNHGIPRLYLDVMEMTPLRDNRDRMHVSVAASFLSEFEGEPKIYASYVTFDPSRAAARRNAGMWLKEEYVERLYRGRVLTDFDQRAPMFSDTLFTLDQALSSPDLASMIAELTRLYGKFDWAQLDRVSYIKHKGDVIMSQSNITVTNSQGVIINSTLTDAQVLVGSMPLGNEAEKKKLQDLLAQLNAALSKSPEGKAEEAGAVAEQAKSLITEAAKPMPNKITLQSLAHMLKNTAGLLKESVPAAITIVTEIGVVIAKLHGIAL